MDYCPWMPLQVEMMASSPDWLTIITSVITAIATPAIAFAGLRIASSQAKTARNTLKLSLYDRRYAIFECASKTIIQMVTGRGTNSVQAEYLNGTIGASWLLNEEIADYLDKTLWSILMDMETAYTMAQQAWGPDEKDTRADWIRKVADLKVLLVRQHEILDKLFSQFLKLEH